MTLRRVGCRLFVHDEGLAAKIIRRRVKKKILNFENLRASSVELKTESETVRLMEASFDVSRRAPRDRDRAFIHLFAKRTVGEVRGGSLAGSPTRRKLVDETGASRSFGSAGIPRP
jgi:hypothetical protein